MADESFGSRWSAVLMCVVLIAGSLVMFALYQGMSAMHPDPHEEDQMLSVSGTLMGEECTGDCVIEFVPEAGDYRLYYAKATLTSVSESKDIRFGIMFGKDDRPVSNMYGYKGTEQIGDVLTSVWTHSENDTDYTIYIGDLCRVLRFVVENDEYVITGDLKG